MKEKELQGLLKEKDIHQALMDFAYEKWQKNRDWSYEKFIDSLSYIEKVAVLTGNLNYQVENGGFMQWITNGYVSKYSELFDILDKICNFFDELKNEEYSDVVLKVKTYVDEVVTLYKDYMQITNDYVKDGIYNMVSELCRNIEREFGFNVPLCVEEEIYKVIVDGIQESYINDISQYDDKYYGIKEDFLRAVEIYLKHLISNTVKNHSNNISGIDSLIYDIVNTLKHLANRLDEYLEKISKK